jgi:two-component system, cell cycle sensor histidine kinase and response regulator CckA
MIVDLNVPGGMGGKETVKAVREMSGTIPIFVASGYADDLIMKNPAGYGFTASISKPFRKAELAEMLNRHLARP